jgi:hypothetical protein
MSKRVRLLWAALAAAAMTTAVTYTPAIVAGISARAID